MENAHLYESIEKMNHFCMERDPDLHNLHFLSNIDDFVFFELTVTRASGSIPLN